MRQSILRGSLASAVTLVAVLVSGSPALVAAASPADPSDFNGDGYADLAIGVPWEGRNAGAISVLYGSRSGLTSDGDQLWSQASRGVAGSPEEWDQFGFDTAAGDFDRDGYADLAAAVPGDRCCGGMGRSAINILYGSAAGLSAAGDQRLTATDIPGFPPGSLAIVAVTSADFNGDGYWDLAIGSPRDFHDAEVSQHGFVTILFGTPDGLATEGAEFLTPELTDAPPGSSFGAALAAGDLDGDGDADLAVETFPGAAVFYARPDGLGGGELWPSVVLPESPAALSIGDFDGDGVGDLAMGTGRAKTVDVIYGTPDGLDAEGRQAWTPDSDCLAGAGSSFGQSLAAGDMDGDGADELVIGAPHHAVAVEGGDIRFAGSVTVLYGSADGLTGAGSQLWTQASPGVPGRARALESFGFALASANYDRSSFGDLAIGAPGYRRGGEVNILYGRSTGLSASGAQLWSQDTPGVKGVSDARDRFGYALAP